MQERAEQLMAAQALIRTYVRIGEIDAAISAFDEKILPALGAVDPRISRLARRISESLVVMCDQPSADPVREIRT